MKLFDQQYWHVETIEADGREPVRDPHLRQPGDPSPLPRPQRRRPRRRRGGEDQDVGPARGGRGRRRPDLRGRRHRRGDGLRHDPVGGHPRQRRRLGRQGPAGPARDDPQLDRARRLRRRDRALPGRGRAHREERGLAHRAPAARDDRHPQRDLDLALPALHGRVDRGLLRRLAGSRRRRLRHRLGQRRQRGPAQLRPRRHGLLRLGLRRRRRDHDQQRHPAQRLREQRPQPQARPPPGRLLRLHLGGRQARRRPDRQQHLLLEPPDRRAGRADGPRRLRRRAPQRVRGQPDPLGGAQHDPHQRRPPLRPQPVLVRGPRRARVELRGSRARGLLRLPSRQRPGRGGPLRRSEADGHDAPAERFPRDRCRSDRRRGHRCPRARAGGRGPAGGKVRAPPRELVPRLPSRGGRRLAGPARLPAERPRAVRREGSRGGGEPAGRGLEPAGPRLEPGGHPDPRARPDREPRSSRPRSSSARTAPSSAAGRASLRPPTWGSRSAAGSDRRRDRRPSSCPGTRRACASASASSSAARDRRTRRRPSRP